MRIALAVSEFPSPSQTFVLDHAAGLIERGHVVDLHAMSRGNLPVLHAGINKHNLLHCTRYAPPSGRRFGPWLQACANDLLWHPLWSARFVEDRSGHRLERLRGGLSFWARAKSYDLIHAHSGYNGMRLLPLYQEGVLDAPLVVTFHGHDANAFLARQPANYYQPLFSRAQALIACSTYMQARLLALGAPAEKLHVIANGVAVEHIPFRLREPPRGRALQLLTVGRLVPFKGLEVLLAALAEPELMALPLTLHVVGDGPLKAALHEQVVRTGLADRVVFYGACAHERVLELMDGSDLYLAPAVVDEQGNTETQGIALLEALASGLPVIASEVGGIPETLGSEAVALLEPGDVAMLSAAILKWARASEAHAERATRGLQRVGEVYGAARWLDALESLYDQLN